MKQKFTNWYSSEVMRELDKGNDLEAIEIKLKLSVKKPLHAAWGIDLYNYFTSPKGLEICIKGWKVTGIFDAINMTLSKLPSLDPFADIDPLMDDNEISLSDPINAIKLQEGQAYITDTIHDTDDSDVEFEHVDDGVNFITRVFDDEE